MDIVGPVIGVLALLTFERVGRRLAWPRAAVIAASLAASIVLVLAWVFIRS